MPSLRFTDVDPKGEDTEKYCQPWVAQHLYSGATQAASSSMVVVLNGIIAKIFQRLGVYQRRHTTKDTKHASFLQILLVEFINTALILLVVSFTNAQAAFQSKGSTSKSY